jgi:hypothetical protein
MIQLRARPELGTRIFILGNRSKQATSKSRSQGHLAMKQVRGPRTTGRGKVLLAPMAMAWPDGIGTGPGTAISPYSDRAKKSRGAFQFQTFSGEVLTIRSTDGWTCQPAATCSKKPPRLDASSGGGGGGGGGGCDGRNASESRGLACPAPAAPGGWWRPPRATCKPCSGRRGLVAGLRLQASSDQRPPFVPDGARHLTKSPRPFSGMTCVLGVHT